MTPAPIQIGKATYRRGDDGKWWGMSDDGQCPVTVQEQAMLNEIEKFRQRLECGDGFDA